MRDELTISPADEEPCLHFSFSLDDDITPFFEDERFTEALPQRARYLDLPGYSMRFHPAGGVHNITPKVVKKFPFPDNTGYYRAGVDADAKLHLVLALLIEAINRGLLVSRFDTQSAAPRLAELIRKYADHPMDFADACLVYLSEQTRESKIVTIDRADFTAYRRHGREPIPLLLPD